MNRFAHSLLLPVTGILFLLTSCSYFNEVDSQDVITISGRVTDETSGDPLEDALIRITEPQVFQQTAVTDTVGQFVFYDISVGDQTDITLEVSREDYGTVYRQLSASPGSDLPAGNISLLLLSEGGTDEESPEVESGPATSLVLTTISEQSIHIRETGGNIYSAISFAAQDSTGRSITEGRSETVRFRIVSGPGDGEALTPSSAETDEQGSVTVNLVSGYSSGVVKIEAVIERDDSDNVVSKPVLITIHGGFPHLDHFSIGADIHNFEGWNTLNFRNTITVLLGDKFSNPVKSGTAVYFNTTGGVIQGSGVGHTDEDGLVTVELISGEPQPADPDLGTGYAIITATTLGEDANGNEVELSKEIPVLFSGSPIYDNISISPQAGFTLPPGGSQTYALTITDENGNPLPAETSVTVEMGNENLDLSGQVDISVPNSLLPGGGVTEFSFTVQDNDEENTDPQTFDITIRAETPGGYSAQRTFGN